MWNDLAVGSVQSVDRAFTVLRCLASGPAGVTDIADRCGLPKSTVSRLLATLNELDVVEQLGSGGDYQIGPTIVELAGGISPTAHLVALARPHLVDLADQLGEATGLAVLDGAQVHYLDQVDGPHAVQVRNWTGERAPAHLVPSGLVLLSAVGEPERERYLAGSLAGTTAHSMTDAKRLRQRLERVGETGVEWVFEEFADGINSVAAVVRGVDGSPVAALHAHGPSYRFPGDRDAERIAAQVAAAAERVAARLAA
jgi:DNA-binding IclR family transcriptional regulator